MAVEGNGNGSIRWRDLTDAEQRLRAERIEALRLHQAEVRERLDKAHVYHTELAATQSAAITGLDTRVDAVESVLDQQRGARNLVYALIGTNALLAIATAVLIVDFVLNLNK